MKTASWLCILLSFTFLLPAGAEDQDWGYYSSILEKGMFPKPPVAAPPPPPPKKVEPPPPNWMINYKVNMVHVHFKTGDVTVGVQNMKGPDGRPLNMTLKEGEAHVVDGIKVEKVDRSEDGTVVTLSRDGMSHPYDLASSVAAPGASAPTRQTAQRGPSRSTSRQPSNPAPQRVSSYKRPKTTQQPKISGKDVQQHLQEYQMEVIRKGLPLLPVGLSADRIEKLKQEGLAVEEPQRPNGR